MSSTKMNDAKVVTKTLISTMKEEMNTLTKDMKAHDERMKRLRGMLEYQDHFHQDHLQAPMDELNELQEMMITHLHEQNILF